MDIPDGLLLVDKPEHFSSAEVVRRVKRALRPSKIGHLGTLDPFATGLLPLCLGTATKLSQFLMSETKSYEGVIQLGVETDTLDPTGKVIKVAPVLDGYFSRLKTLATEFEGEYLQTPPMYSALKQNGVPLYKLARRGIEVKQSARRVSIYKLILSQVAGQSLSFSVTCSKGTYIRTLAADIGEALGTKAHLAKLRRTQVGQFSVQQSWPLERIEQSVLPEDIPFISMVEATKDYRTFTFNDKENASIRQGRQEPLQELPFEEKQCDIARILDDKADLVAIIVKGKHEWKLARVF